MTSSSSLDLRGAGIPMPRGWLCLCELLICLIAYPYGLISEICRLLCPGPGGVGPGGVGAGDGPAHFVGTKIPSTKLLPAGKLPEPP